MSQNQYQFNSKLCIFQFVWAIDSKMYIILGYCKTKIIHCYTMKNLKKNKNVEHRNKNHFHFSRKFFRTQVGPLARWSVPFVFRLWSTILKKKQWNIFGGVRTVVVILLFSKMSNIFINQEKIHWLTSFASS